MGEDSSNAEKEVKKRKEKVKGKEKEKGKEKDTGKSEGKSKENEMKLGEIKFDWGKTMLYMQRKNAFQKLKLSISFWNTISL